MQRVKNSTSTGHVHPWDRIPIILKSLSGFSSCITVATMSVVFILSVNNAVDNNVGDWPSLGQMFLMMMGPIIIAWNFVNARSIITTILTHTGEEAVEKPKEQKVVIPTNSPIITESDFALERELVGPATVILRAIAGCFATHVICFCSLVFTWTVHIALSEGRPMPSDLKLFLIVIGPIVTSWNFVRASSTLTAVMAGSSALERFRGKIADAISPKK